MLFSILIGASSHLFWDGFTHEHGFLVQKISFLKDTTDIFGKQIPIFKIFQHSSTLIGGLTIAFAVYKLPTDKRITLEINAKYWIVFIALTLIIIAMRLLSGLNIKQYGNVIVTTISATIISLVLTAILIPKSTKKNSL
ncbi:MAG: DUF4184 family protein [Bacteroidia bacterium]